MQLNNALRAGKNPEEIAAAENEVRWTAAAEREVEEGWCFGCADVMLGYCFVERGSLTIGGIPSG